MDYRITRVETRLDFTPQGRVYKVYRVYFECCGIEDYVDVPEGQYSEAHVKKLIEEIVKTHKALLGQ